MTRRKEDYRALREQGVCVACRQVSSAPERTRCWDCLAKYNAATRARRVKAGKKGLCRYCCKRKATSPRGLACIKCLKAKNRRAREWRKEWREQKLCTSCGGEIPFAREGYSTCGSKACTSSADRSPPSRDPSPAASPSSE